MTENNSEGPWSQTKVSESCRTSSGVFVYIYGTVQCRRRCYLHSPQHCNFF